MKEYIIPFGKYKGENLYEVVEVNPNYIIWLNDKTSFYIPLDLLNDAQDYSCFYIVPDGPNG